MKILDCTLRDGGYYTKWDFDHNVVERYVCDIENLPIDYIELGYRNLPKNVYLGEFGYCPKSTLRYIRSLSTKKIGIMLNEKDCSVNDLSALLHPIIGLVDMVRLAVDPKHFERAISLAIAVKEMGFEVAFNMMYMSTWEYIDNFYPKLSKLNGVVDLFCMVDSYGSIIPKLLESIIDNVRKYTTCTLGFHGHDNLSLGLANAIVAIDSGVEFVDTTILGMGRGAGNLKTELLLTYLNKHIGLFVDFNSLGSIVETFDLLHKSYNWGTNLPYMLSGVNSIPQKDVMALVLNRRYSLNNILSALEQKRGNLSSCIHCAKFNPQDKYEKVIIIGGGNSAVGHLKAIKTFISNQKSIAIVFATARFAAEYASVDCPKFYILVGSEAKRMRSNIDSNKFNDICILPPSPHTMGIDVPEFGLKFTYELPQITFEKEYVNSCTTLALETARLLTENIYLVGYDGYNGPMLTDKEIALTAENRCIFETYELFFKKPLVSLFPTLYEKIDVQSIYHMI